MPWQKEQEQLLQEVQNHPGASTHTSAQLQQILKMTAHPTLQVYRLHSHHKGSTGAAG